MQNKSIDLIKEIIEKIPNNLTTDLEKAYYIYIKLGEIFEFNTTYFNTTPFHSFLIRHKSYNVSNITEREIICHNWCDIYIELLKQVGIKARKEGKDHVWVIIKLEEYFLYADATYDLYNDLSRIKHHDYVKHFYPTNNEKIKGIPAKIKVDGFDEKIKEINQKINYQPTRYQTLLKLRKYVSSLKTTKEKLDYLLNQESYIGNGYYEERTYFRYLLMFCLESYDINKLNFSELRRTNPDGTVDLMACLSLEEDNTYYYFVFSNQEGFVPVSKEELLNYQNENFGLVEKQPIHGIDNYLLKFQVPKNILPYLIRNKFTFQNKINSLSKGK